MVSCHIFLDDDALAFLADISNGDARRALNAIELAAKTTDIDPHTEKRAITIDVIQDCVQKKAVRYDKDGDEHYDTISAFIKSMRGSDPDATLFYLAKMFEAGEDIKFIARRIIVHAAEDVGLANPDALSVAVNAATAAMMIGMPEARIPLAEAAVYVAVSPKSAAIYKGIDAAIEVVRTIPTQHLPHLQDTHYKSAKKLGRGIGYLYPHDFPKHYVPQQYLPDAIADKRFYYPTMQGYEQNIIALRNWQREEAQ